MPVPVKKEYEIVRQGQEEVLKIDATKWPYSPSIEENPLVMSKIIERLVEFPSTSRIILIQKKNYEYDYEQTQTIIEIANLYKHLTKQKRVLTLKTSDISSENFKNRVLTLQYLVYNLLKTDPFGCYIEAKRISRESRVFLNKVSNEQVSEEQDYISKLDYIVQVLEETKLIKLFKDQLNGYQIGDRYLYKQFYKPNITPIFLFTKIYSQIPEGSKQLDSYSLRNMNVSIFKLKEDVKNFYQLTPPELKLTEDQYEILNIARRVLSEHKPKDEEFLEPNKLRRTFFNIGRDLILDLLNNQNIDMDLEDVNELSKILVRYTIGFGAIELLLQDPKIQDIVVNSPIGQTPVFIMHEDFDECVTNIIPSSEDAEGWATKFRLLSGRPLDEANPILDTELSIPGARARVAVISEPLSKLGLAYSFRRHRDSPWTFPLFIKNKMINSLGAGLLSFLINGNRTMLFAGTRSSGKTSILGASLLEIMKKYRILVIEDTEELNVEAMRKIGYNIQSMKVRAALSHSSSEVSADEGIRTALRLGDSALIVGEVRSSIRGNEEVLIVENGMTKRLQIKDLENKDISNIFIPSMDFDLKFKLKKLKAFVKHPKRTKLLEVVTKTGRKVTVTPDHSLFTAKDFKIVPIECQDISKGTKIVIPEKLPLGYNDINSINLLDILEEEECKVTGYEEDLKEIINKIGYKRASQIAKCTNDIYQYLRKGIQHTNLSINNYKNLAKEANLPINSQILQVKTGSSKTLNTEIPITKEFCRFLGYYASEGWTDLNGDVVFSNGDKIIIEDIINLSKNLFGIDPYIRQTKSLGISTQINLNNKILGLFLKNLGCGRVALEKRIPELIYGLSEEKVCEFLKGYFDGDGSQTSIITSGNRIACSTISRGLANDLLYLFLQLGIVARAYTKEIKGIGKHISYVIEFKQRKYVELFLQKVGFTKYKKEIINRGFSHSKENIVNFDIKVLENNLKLTRKFRHLRRTKCCGKDYLKKVVKECENSSELIKSFAYGDFYIDEIKEIKEINLDEGEYVYDLSVEPCQNFIGGFGGIMLHNTEALALYEAMRIGAMANVVAGTIHGDSPYGVFDRVVNDLKVPRTSFKATDIIIISNPVKSPDGLHKFRRVLSITEVRKHWEKDPLREKGFVDLMKYNPETDQLEPTEDLINGDSEILKAIASTTKEWTRDWNSLWENILLRAKINQSLVDYSTKLNRPDILESEFIVRSSDAMHKIMEVVGLNNEKIYSAWKEWLKRELI